MNVRLGLRTRLWADWRARQHVIKRDRLTMVGCLCVCAGVWSPSGLQDPRESPPTTVNPDPSSISLCDVQGAARPSKLSEKTVNNIKVSTLHLHLS